MSFELTPVLMIKGGVSPLIHSNAQKGFCGTLRSLRPQVSAKIHVRFFVN